MPVNCRGPCFFSCWSTCLEEPAAACHICTFTAVFLNLSENASFPYLGILCAWTTTQMPRGSCWPPPPPADWRRQPGRPRITWLSTIQQDLKHHHLKLPKAADLAQNRPLWRMMSTYGATQPWVACQKRRTTACDGQTDGRTDTAPSIAEYDKNHWS